MPARAWTTLVLVAAAALSGCTGLQLQVRSPEAEALDGQPPEISTTWRYGQFCGKDHPALDPAQGPLGQIRFLLGLSPVDDVDRACQFHDICYVANGSPSRLCDKALSWNLKLIATRLPKVEHELFGVVRDRGALMTDPCARLVTEIEHYAEVAAGLNADDLRDRVVGGLSGVALAVASAPTHLLGSALSTVSGVGQQPSLCLATEPLPLLFPSSPQELNALRGCYREPQGFGACPLAPRRSRHDGHPALPDADPLTVPAASAAPG
ncbi:hypothetical protein [Ideonella livida]|uniref:Phospholipase A2 n=1 Tax=Ideonella livida TaxID=2707176 RepID=A0A7C9PEH0_9BURK|nr:hypothetical protein [Ideonella livida]NDY89836.1 hypothetical protein [Ideonella livida]